MNISPTLWSSQCLLVGKGLSSHPWDVASELGAARLSSAGMPWPEDSPWMLFRGREALLGVGWDSFSGFQQWEGRRRWLLVQAGAQERSAQPKDWEGSRQGIPGQGTRGWGHHRGLAAPHHHRLGHHSYEPQHWCRLGGCMGALGVPARMVTMRTFCFPWGAPVSILPCDEIIHDRQSC